MIELEKYKAGHIEKTMGYNYFVPTEINNEWIWRSPQINNLLEKAAVKLGELNSFARLVPNIDLFIQLHVTKEAVISSRIEGTQTNMDEALLPIDDIRPERRNDAVFIPPAQTLLNPLMGDLEKFLNNDEINVPSLIRIAIAHYQFETIHPFLDGNGRIGRLLITLFLVSQGILDKPLLYLSMYFEKNKALYYDSLSFVRSKNDMTQWIKYFLLGVEQTATLAVKTLSEILLLKENIEKEITATFGRRSHSALTLLNALFKAPIVTVDKAKEICDLSYKSANDLIVTMQEKQYLKEMTGQVRNRIFLFEPYLKAFDN